MPRTGVLITRSREIESSGILDDFQVRDHVFDLGALVKRKAADHVILQLVAAHGFFKQPRLRVGAVEHGGAGVLALLAASRRYFEM